MSECSSICGKLSWIRISVNLHGVAGLCEGCAGRSRTTSGRCCCRRLSRLHPISISGPTDRHNGSPIRILVQVAFWPSASPQVRPGSFRLPWACEARVARARTEPFRWRWDSCSLASSPCMESLAIRISYTWHTSCRSSFPCPRWCGSHSCGGS